MFSKANTYWKLMANVTIHRLISISHITTPVMLGLLVLFFFCTSGVMRIIEIISSITFLLWILHFIVSDISKFNKYYNKYRNFDANISKTKYDDERIIVSYQLLFMRKKTYTTEEINNAIKTCTIAMRDLYDDIWNYNPGQYEYTQIAIVHEVMFSLRDTIAEEYKRHGSILNDDFKDAYLELGASLFMYLDAPNQFRTIVRVISRF